MPELPEVETVKNKLKERLLNKRILDINILYNNIIEYPSVIDFKKEIINPDNLSGK
jgi:formamidopyrimidine-DNA glycosylase